MWSGWFTARSPERNHPAAKAASLAFGVLKYPVMTKFPLTAISQLFELSRHQATRARWTRLLGGPSNRPSVQEGSEFYIQILSPQFRIQPQETTIKISSQLKLVCSFMNIRSLWLDEIWHDSSYCALLLASASHTRLVWIHCLLKCSWTCGEDPQKRLV